MNVGIVTENDFTKVNGVTTTLRAVLKLRDGGIRRRVYTLVDASIPEGQVVGIGPFANLGNMAIVPRARGGRAVFETDPFILEGLIKSLVIRDWTTPC